MRDHKRLTLTEFNNLCNEVFRPLYYSYATVNQGEEARFSTKQETSIYKSMDICLVPNLISFKNGRSTLTFNRVSHVLMYEECGSFVEFEIVCTNGDKYTILADKSVV